MFSKILAFATMSAGTLAAAMTPQQLAISKMSSEGIAGNSDLGRNLIKKSRRLADDDDEQEFDMSFVAEYSIKFLGCHHVTQWNEEGEGDDGSRIMSKGLVRYRLCPSGSCSSSSTLGCSSNYGEYVVDMVTFLSVYVEWQIEEMQYRCATYKNTCYRECYQSASASCYSTCYSNYGIDPTMCQYDQDGGDDSFDIEEYIYCAAWEGGYNGNNNNRQLEDDVAVYLGPYCSDQGGDIRLGFFKEDSCTIASEKQYEYFEKYANYEIPYTKNSLVTNTCMSCELSDEDGNGDNGGNNNYYNYDADGNRNYYVAKEVNELCGTVYMASGKCEKNINSVDVPYPEEGACTYIEGVKMLKTDGIIRSDSTATSTPANIAIGVFSGTAVMMCGYVYYLKSKLARSRVNLANASTSLT